MHTNILWPLTVGLGLAQSAQAPVKTGVPEVVPGAKPARVEHIQIHGAALEGNLEGTHTSAVAVRFQNFVMPFFSKNLCSGKICQ